MKKFIKLALTAAAVISTTSAFAAHVTQPLHHKLMTKTAATQPSGIIIGGDWMFLRPSNYSHRYGYVITNNGVTSTSEPLTINNGLQAGSHLFVGYGNPQTDAGIQLAWTHLDTSRSGNYSTNNPNTTFFNNSGNSTSNLISGNMRGSSSYDYDAVDLTLTKAMQKDGKLNWQMFAGVRYAEINHHLDSTINYSNFNGDMPSFLANSTYISNYSTDFRGFGPRLGINANYELFHGVKVFGQVAVSLLYSKLTDKNVNTQNIYPVDGPSISVTNTKRSFLDREGITPGFDAQLGLSYDHPFHGAIVGIRAGYQVDYYQDATAQADLNGNINVQNVSFSGPFVGLVLHG